MEAGDVVEFAGVVDEDGGVFVGCVGVAGAGTSATFIVVDDGTVVFVVIVIIVVVVVVVVASDAIYRDAPLGRSGDDATAAVAATGIDAVEGSVDVGAGARAEETGAWIVGSAEDAAAFLAAGVGCHGCEG